MSHVALHPAAPTVSAAAHRVAPLSRLLPGAALAAAAAGLLAVAMVVDLADAVPASPGAAAPVPALAATAAVRQRDPSVPDASTALAGRGPDPEQQAPTF